MISLLSKGPQDVFITGNPEISYFRSSYKKHTSFSQQISEQVLEGIPGNGNISTICFEKKGDILSYAYLKCLDGNSVKLLTKDQWLQNISKIELLIGGSVIDSQTSEYLETVAIDTMATNLARSFLGSYHGGDSYFFPFRFHFFEQWSAGIPLVALKYSNVEIRITWNQPDPGVRFQCMAMYTFLDEDERNLFMNRPIHMLIKQIQENIPSKTNIQDLTFNHPVTYIAIPNTTKDDQVDQLFSLETKIKLQLNGVDYIDYVNVIPDLVQVPCYFHCPFSVGNETDFMVFVFCLNTAEHNPCGYINFSRIDSARLLTTIGTFTSTIFAVNFNIFTVKNGMGGLMFAT